MQAKKSQLAAEQHEAEEVDVALMAMQAQKAHLWEIQNKCAKDMEAAKDRRIEAGEEESLVEIVVFGIV